MLVSLALRFFAWGMNAGESFLPEDRCWSKCTAQKASSQRASRPSTCQLAYTA